MAQKTYAIHTFILFFIILISSSRIFFFFAKLHIKTIHHIVQVRPARCGCVAAHIIGFFNHNLLNIKKLLTPL
eukprot:UN04027